MPLLDHNRFPPGGFPYREPSLNWKAPADGLGFSLRVLQIQAVRAANPASGLDPSAEGCAEALDLYTCTRLKNDPEWCVAASDPVAKALARARQPVPCPSCSHKTKRL